MVIVFSYLDYQSNQGKRLSATALDGLVEDQRDELEALRAAVRLCAAHLRSRSAAQMSRDEVANLLERAARVV